jgi:hypothetical protein
MEDQWFASERNAVGSVWVRSKTEPDWIGSECNNPETLLMEFELSQPPNPPRDLEMGQTEYLQSCLHDRDRVLWFMLSSGMTQSSIGETLGIEQPSVAERISRIISWGRTVAPVRLALVLDLGARCPALPRAISGEVRGIFNRAVWAHQYVDRRERTKLTQLRKSLPTGHPGSRWIDAWESVGHSRWHVPRVGDGHVR